MRKPNESGLRKSRTTSQELVSSTDSADILGTVDYQNAVNAREKAKARIQSLVTRPGATSSQETHWQYCAVQSHVPETSLVGYRLFHAYPITIEGYLVRIGYQLVMEGTATLRSLRQWRDDDPTLFPLFTLTPEERNQRETSKRRLPATPLSSLEEAHKERMEAMGQATVYVDAQARVGLDYSLLERGRDLARERDDEQAADIIDMMIDNGCTLDQLRFKPETKGRVARILQSA